MDTFHFARGGGDDTIYGFQTPGNRSFIKGAQLAIGIEGIDGFLRTDDFVSQTGGGVLFDFGNGDTLFLAGTQRAALDEYKISFY